MRKLLALLLGIGAIVGIVYYRNEVSGGVEDAAADVEATVTGWENVDQGPVWVPVINEAESAAGIPTNLLARMAYQESHFRSDIIDGTTPSSAGALGILQLMPQYFSTVQVPTPFSTADTQAQITQAAQQLASLYAHFNDWGYAVAAYDCGETELDGVLAGTAQMPTETVNYVSDVLADVPVQTQLNA